MGRSESAIKNLLLRAMKQLRETGELYLGSTAETILARGKARLEAEGQTGPQRVTGSGVL